MTREEAFGTKRADIYIKYGNQRIIIELKIFGNDSRKHATEQVLGYLQFAPANAEGYVVFFCRPGESHVKVPFEEVPIGGKTIGVWEL